jgi:AcrR family transcriptional regulator
MVKGRLPAAQRRQQLLSVARAVLAQRGYHSTTMTDIAEAAGVTKPVLYQHFTSKRDLYRIVLEDIGARLEASIVEGASAAQSPRDRAAEGIRAYANFVEEDDDGFQLLFNGTNRQDEEWAAITTAVERSLAQAVASLIDVPTIDAKRRQVLAHGIIGLAESMMRYAKQDEQLAYSQDELVHDISSLTWSGLRGLD